MKKVLSALALLGLVAVALGALIHFLARDGDTISRIGIPMKALSSGGPTDAASAKGGAEGVVIQKPAEITEEDIRKRYQEFMKEKGPTGEKRPINVYRAYRPMVISK